MLTKEESDDRPAESRQGRPGQGRRNGQVDAARPQLVQTDGAYRPLGDLLLLEVSRRVRVLRGPGVISRPEVQDVVRLPRRVQIEGTRQQEDRQDESPGGSPHEHGFDGNRSPVLARNVRSRLSYYR